MTPGEKLIAENEMRRSLPRHKGAVRQIVQMAGPFFLPTRRTIDAFQMQRPVHFLSARRLGGPIGDAPGLGPGVVVVSPAFVTGAVPGGEGDRRQRSERSEANATPNRKFRLTLPRSNMSTQPTGI